MQLTLRTEIVVHVSNEQYLELEKKYRENWATEIKLGEVPAIMSDDDFLELWKQTRDNPHREEVDDLEIVWDFAGDARVE